MLLMQGGAKFCPIATGLLILFSGHLFSGYLGADEGIDYAFDELVALAREAPAFGALADPNDAMFTEPGDMPARIRAFCTATGQTPPADAGATARCILESLALKHAETIPDS